VLISLMFWRKYERCIVGGIVNKFSFATRTLILVGNNFYSTRFGSLYVNQYIPKSIDERWGVIFAGLFQSYYGALLAIPLWTSEKKVPDPIQYYNIEYKIYSLND